MAKNDARVYVKAYRKAVKNKILVNGCKYNAEVSEIIENETDFRQCYKRGDRIREELPRYWFVSKEGFLLSVKNKEKPKWIKPNMAADRPEFKISKYNKSITTYMLVALVWDSLRSEMAQKIMDERGVQALGKIQMNGSQNVAKVQAHHLNGYLQEKTLENYIINNDPEKLQVVTVREHDAMNKIQDGKRDSSIFYQPTFMEVPNETPVIFDMNKPRLLDPSQIVIDTIINYEILPEEQDSILTDEYYFIMKDGREFLETQKHLLTKFVNDRPGIPNPLHFTVDGVEHHVWYRKR